jgi:uncharacterized repeat protein (TIGR02543 family)
MLIMFFGFTIVACGGSDTPNNPNTGNQFSIVFISNGGTSIQSITKNEGSQVSKPADPTKDEYIFGGWFYDSSLSSAVSWPITLVADITIYAKWSNSVEYFLNARDNTVNANQFEYDFNLSVDIAYGPIDGPSAIIDGNVKYNSSASNTYYKYEQNSGLLLPDGIIHTIKTGSELAVMKANMDGKLYDYEKKSVSNDFKYESSSYAKVLFEYTESQIQSVNLVENGKYQINYSGSATGLVNMAIGIINNPILSQFLNIPNSDSSLHVYVTYENDLIDTFEYEFNISLSGASITFHYDLDFKKVGSGVTISIPTFNGVSLTDTEIASKTSLINNAISGYRLLNQSGYSYDVKTSIDYPGKFAIDAHIQGRTMRQILNNNVFFWNRIELDSDYKNNDLYQNNGIVDYERYRVMYANGDVYDVIDGFPSNTYTKIVDYDNSLYDNYYFLIPTTLLNENNVSIIQEFSDGNKNTYSIGLNANGIISLMDFIDMSVRVDVNELNEVKIYNVESGLEITKCDFTIVVNNGNLESIEINITGAYNSNPYAGTVFSGPCSFSLSANIVVNSEGANYTPPTKNSEVELPNS